MELGLKRLCQIMKWVGKSMTGSKKVVTDVYICGRLVAITNSVIPFSLSLGSGSGNDNPILSCADKASMHVLWCSLAIACYTSFSPPRL
jgi:hypothetical protein